MLSFKDSEGVLTQTGIKRAFSNKQRQSGYIITHNRTKITLLNGKHTERLGVTKMTGCYGEQLELTDLERTLIDIAVRPAYAGGRTFVLEAYRRTKSKASVVRQARMLEELEYVYPYHQAIGFYLQSAGYATPKLRVLRKPGIKFDFILAHGMKRMLFDKEWRIYYPEDLQRRNNIET